MCLMSVVLPAPFAPTRRVRSETWMTGSLILAPPRLRSHTESKDERPQVERRRHGSPQSVVKVRMPAELGQRVSQELETEETGAPEPPRRQAHRRRAEGRGRNAGTYDQQRPTHEPGK